MNGFLHKLSPCPLYVIFNWEKKKNTKKKMKKEVSEKKTTLYMLYISLSH